MKTISLKLPDDLASELMDRARSERTTKSALVREALAEYFTGAPAPAGGSFLARAGGLVGCLEGPAELSHDPRHLEDYGR